MRVFSSKVTKVHLGNACAGSLQVPGSSNFMCAPSLCTDLCDYSRGHTLASKGVTSNLFLSKSLKTCNIRSCSVPAASHAEPFPPP